MGLEKIRQQEELLRETLKNPPPNGKDPLAHSYPILTRSYLYYRGRYNSSNMGQRSGTIYK